MRYCLLEDAFKLTTDKGWHQESLYFITAF